MTPTASPPRSIRKDALRNRALLLESADALIREHGIELSLNAVAHHAGVGVGTVYRHFPDREALIGALFEERVDQIAAILSEHENDEDPVAALHSAVLEICEAQCADRGVWAVMSTGSRDSHREMVQARVLPLADKLVLRANATGRLRAAFETSDLPILLWTGGALNAYLGDVSPTAWRRYIQLLLNSYLSDDDPARRALEHRPLTIDEIDTAMSRYAPPVSLGESTRPHGTQGSPRWPAT